MIGDTIRNLDDGSEGVISANTATTIAVSLSGGTDNAWHTGDEYELVLPPLDGVFGSDLLTSGWVDAFMNGADDGYFQQVHFDFRDMDTLGTGTLYFDLSHYPDDPDRYDPIPPGPGIRVLETLGQTAVTEGGDPDYYRIVLTDAPAPGTQVRVDLDLSNGEVTAFDDAHPDNTFLIFDDTNWAVPQIVRVTAVNDNVAEGTHYTQISHTISSLDPRYDGMEMTDVTVMIIDDDVPFLEIVQSGGSTDVTEGGPGDSFTVMPVYRDPSGAVLVQLPTDDPQLKVTAAEPYLGFFYDSLIFSDDEGNWSTPQTVLVDANDDLQSEGPQDVDIVLELIDNNFHVIGYQTLTVHITDNEPWVAIVESSGVTDVAEATPPGPNDVDSYTVVLGKNPTADVYITVDPDPQVDLGAGPGEPIVLTFTSGLSGNWDQPQTVSVTAVDDELAEGTHQGRITHTVSSEDPGYDGLQLRDVVARITDNDDAGAVIVQSNGNTTVAEGGVDDTYTVVLTSEPRAEVRIYLENDDGQVTAVDDAHPGNSYLVFRPDTDGIPDEYDWNVPHTVRVTAVDDGLMEETTQTQISHHAFSTDSRYQGVQYLTVTVLDNDQALSALASAADVTAENVFPQTVTVTYASTTNPIDTATIGDGDVPRERAQRLRRDGHSDPGKHHRLGRRHDRGGAV